MSAKTPIQWTGRTWNPIAAFLKVAVKVGDRVFRAGTRGWFCVKVSPGCLNCYAEGINLRLGNGLTYAKVHLDQIEWRLVNLLDPLKWRKPQTVFVDSMSDLFYEAIPDGMIDAVFAVMAMCPQHTFQVLTKRHVRMRDYVNGECLVHSIHGRSWRIREAGHAFNLPIHAGVNFWLPLPNVWLGVSVEDQQRANERVPALLQTPAAIRFLSCEPLLGPVEITQYLPCYKEPGRCKHDRIHWVIAGGESGRAARPCNMEWIRGIVAQCHAADVAVFVKQLGALPIETIRKKGTDDPFSPVRYRFRDSHGGDMSEWPEDLRVREFPKIREAVPA